MGRRKKKSQKKTRDESADFADSAPSEYDELMIKERGAKYKSKISRKLRKQMARKQMSKYPGESCNRDKPWHKIKVEPSVEKAFLLSSISNYVEDVEFKPLGYHKEGDAVCFYIEGNAQVAKSVGALDKRLQGVDGNVMSISVTSLSAPDVFPNAAQLEALKETVIKRYSQTTSQLDLSSLHSDQALIERDILAPLSSSVIFRLVIRTIKEYMGDVKTLILKGNRLTCENMKNLQLLHSPNSCLRSLHLQQNNLNSFIFLKELLLFKLEEVYLDGNLMVKTVKNSRNYVNIVKKFVPLLKILDGKNVSLETAGSSNTSNIMIDETLLHSYLNQYFALIDTPERGNLLQAYTSNAKVCIQSSIPKIGNEIFEGQLGIEHFLRCLPMTKHIPSSFKLNVVSAESSSGCVELSGTCHFDGFESPLNFLRRMVIVPYNSGLCCSDEILELKL